jgi:tripartite-type tricarboxylate transporter receptor subunit TctC
MRIRYSALVAAGGLALVPAPAVAQTFPSRTISIIVPAPPGGVTDVLGRAVAQRFSEAWGQQAIVENRAGGNNQIAAEHVLRSPPDGHTILLSPEVTFVVNPFLYPKLNYDAQKDFVPVVGLVSIRHAMLVHPSVPANTVAELLALAKQKPGSLNYGTFGSGSSGHLNMELLQSHTGAKFTPVHYRGATPALTDVIAGHIQMMFVSTGTAVPPARAGKVKLLGIGSRARIPQLPDYPAIAETVPGFEAISWFALFVARGTPQPIVDKINAEVRALFADAAFRERVLDRYYFAPIAETPEALAARIRADEAKWSKVIREAGIKAE